MSLNHRPDGASSLQELLLEWEDAQRRGEPRSPGDLCRECPELLAPLELKIGILEALERRFGMIQRDTENIAPDTESKDRTELLPADRLFFHSEYELQRFHAQGGLGVVYIARDKAFQREVAVKFAHRRRLSSADQARFRREAEITGRLEHPGIVPVYAVNPAGCDDPCYVMRWVDGETLQDAIDRVHPSDRPLSVDFQSVQFRGLLQRFISVCNTAAYAHERGVIHRDIKPRNILLGSFGETLLLDWGLAKQSGAAGSLEDSDNSKQRPRNDDMTHPGDVLGTLAYASPEQLSGQSSAVDSRSDVFSLGATLYAMLTGMAPYVEQKLSNGGVLTRGMIVAPSARNGMIPRALEAICHHALSTAPGDRYATSKELADEIERYLADEPVRVAKEGLSARVLRWLRKNRTKAATAAAAVFVSLLAVTCGAVLLGGKNRELARLNKNVRDQLAESQANLQLAVSAVDQFCTNVSEELRLKEADLNPLRRKLLNSAIAFHEELLHRRGMSSSAHVDLARSYSRLASLARETDSNPRAIEWYRDSIREYRAALTDRPRDESTGLELIQNLSSLGHVLAETGQFTPAKSAMTESLARVRTMCDNKTSASRPRQALTRSLVLAAFVHQSVGDFDQAEVVLREAVANAETYWKSPSDDADQGWELARTHLNLGEVYLLQGLGNWRDAEASFLKARDIGLELLGQSSGSPANKLLVAQSHYQLGIVSKITGRKEESRAALQAAIAIEQSVCRRFPSRTQYADSLANSYKQLGHVEFLDGRNDEAEEAYQRAERTLRPLIQRYPGDLLRESIHADLQKLLAEMCRIRGDLDTALHHADAAVDSLNRILKQSRAFKNAITLLPDALSERATVLIEIGKYPESLEDWDRLLSINKATYLAPWYQIRRARTLVHLGRHAEATAAVTESLPAILDNCQGHQAVEMLLLAARIDGQSSVAARHDPSLTPKERQQRMDDYLRRAAEHLRQARDAGMTAEDEQRLRETSEFEPLRELVGEMRPSL